MVLTTKTKPRSTTHHKQRQGRHHKKDEHYLRPYWPYLPLVLIVLAGIVFSTLWGATQKGVLGYATEMSAASLLNGTNNQRAVSSLGTLTLNSKLNQAAQAKANDMVARNYWSHNTPDGATPWTFFINAGYDYQTAGENLAYGFDNSDAAITAWMNSPEHKANILGNYTEVGFGFANSTDYQGTGPETIVVAMYGSPHAVAAAPAASKPTLQSTPVTSTPAPATQQTPTATEPAPVTTSPAEQPKETNATIVAATPQQPSAKTIATKNVSRIQLLTKGQAAWSTFAVTALAIICVAVFFLRHGIFWHRTLVKGERFIMHHKALDFALVLLVVAGFVLTRTAGVIH